MSDLALSEQASEAAKLIHSTILKVIGHDAYTGGCRAFYTPEEWKAKGEKYGLNATLIIAHDGGDLADYFGPMAPDELIIKMENALSAIGYYADLCTGWYSAVYPV